MTRKIYRRTADILTVDGTRTPATDQTLYYRTLMSRVMDDNPTLHGLVAAEVVDSDPPEYREVLSPDVWAITYTEVI